MSEATGRRPGRDSTRRRDPAQRRPEAAGPAPSDPTGPVHTGLLAEVLLRRPDFTLDLGFRIGHGEVVAILGPNGAGKSTVLSLLAGLIVADRGRIDLDGRVLLDTERRIAVPAHRRGVGLLAQDALLFPHLSALANVEFGPRAAGRSRAQSRAAADHWLGEVGAADLAGACPRELSGGQAQRVAVARALAAEPDLLLLDEPLAALDVDAAPAIRALLRRVLAADGRTTVLVTHDLLDALVLADRVLVLSAGRVVEDGPTREVLARPTTAFTARIAGLNLLPGRLCPDGLVVDGGDVIAGQHASGESVVEGEPGVAVFAPGAVAVYRQRPTGSPRNVLTGLVAGIEPHGDGVRVRAAAPPGGPRWVEGVAADVTLAALAELGLQPGSPVWFAVKATEVAVHRVAGG